MRHHTVSIHRGPACLLGSTALATALLLVLGTTANGQTAGTTASDSGSGLQEIVVTAQKREQRLQDVPIAVTAVTQSTLAVNRVTTIMDLASLAPGLSARPNPGDLGAPAFGMRGIYATAAQPSSDREISTYLDGVYIGSTRAAIFDLPDTQQIEVLRGPQGTLFGRNATAGAISVNTRDPSGTFHLRQDVTVGNYDQFRSRTSLDLPAVGPFSAYITYVHDQRRGDVRNLGAGTTFDRASPISNIGGVQSSPEWLGSHNTNDVFAALRFEATNDLTMTYKFDYSNGTNTPEARATVVLNPNSFVGGLLAGALATQQPGGGAYGPIVLNPGDQRPDAINNAWAQTGFEKVQGHNLTTTWQATDNLSFKNVTAYRKQEVFGPATIMGLDGLEYTAATKAFFTAPQVFLGGASYAQAFGKDGSLPTGSYFAGYEGNNYGKGWQVSSETQANYRSKLLTLTAGALWYHSSEVDGGVPGMAANYFFGPVPEQLPVGNVQDAAAKVTSLAAYAQGEVHITPTLDIVLGGRITRDKKSGSLTNGGSFVGSTLTGALVYPWTFENSKPTFSVGATYKPDNNLLAYAKFSTAFLSGGAVGPLSFAPETVESAEAGVKSEWFDRRLRVNVAVYHAYYKHLQSSQSGQNVSELDGTCCSQFSVVVVDNGSERADGAELEVAATPLHGVSIGGSLSYTDAKLLSPSPFVAQGDPFLINGIPPWSGSMNAQYESEPIFNEATLFFRIDGNYQGKFRAIPNPNTPTEIPAFAPYQFVPGRIIVNGRVAIHHIKFGGAEGEVAVWTRNLLDNKDTTAPLDFGGAEFDSSYQPARTFGVDLSVHL